jgi:hypothetical protein
MDGYLLNYPDELMIDWGNTPDGSVANIYWPQVDASKVIDQASEMYPAQKLKLADGHTVRCKVGRDMTYIPIPQGSGENFAGLITLELPNGIRVGHEFNVVVRRLTSRRYSPNGVRTQESVGTRKPINWRYVVGTFRMQIPVDRDEAILPSEENLLAVLKWRLDQTSATDRWYPVLQRYVGVVSERVKGFGGQPGAIVGSQHGITTKPTGKGKGHPTHAKELEFTGKVTGLLFDRFADFDGFFLMTESGEEHRFHSRQAEIGRLVRAAWEDSMRVSVFAHKHEPHVPAYIVLRQRPPSYWG